MPQLIGTPYTTEQLQQAGFSGDEISQHIERQRPALRQAGFVDVEIDQYYHIKGYDDEKQFREWYGGWSKKLGLNPNPDDPQHFYDYRAAFRAGAKPDKSGHWPSEFKLGGHPNLVVDAINTKTGQPIDFSDMPWWDDQTILQSYMKDKPIDTWVDLEDGLSETIAELGRTFQAQGYKAAETWHLSWGHLVVGLEEGLRYLKEKDLKIRNWVEGKKTEAEQPQAFARWTYDILGKAKDKYEEHADYWAKRVNDVGINYLDEFFGGLIGGTTGGLAEWFLNVPWATLQGAIEAQKKGENEWVGAFTKAAERQALGMIFHSMGPLRKYLQSPLMGTVMGIQAAAEGGDISKAVGTGAILPWFAPGSPGEKMGLNDWRKSLRRESNKLLEKKVYDEKDEIARNLPTTRDPITSENLDLFPQDHPEINGTAVMYKGRIYTPTTNPTEPHPMIAMENGLLNKEIIPGFIDKNGQFLYQYPEEAAKTLRKWDQDGINIGEPFVHFRTTGTRVQGILSPEEHMGLIHGSEKKLAATYGKEKEGGIFISRIYGYKSPTDKEGVIPSGGFYIGRINGPILRASSPEAQKLYEKARTEVGAGKMYSPEDAGAIQLIFERNVRDAGYAALDTESQQGYKIFTDQFVANISPDFIGRLYTNLVSNGGITYDLMTDTDMNGMPQYAVSPYKARERTIAIDKFSDVDVKQYIADNYDLLTLPDHNLGGWKRGDEWVLDVTKTVPDKMDAIRLMEQNNQESIYDLKNGIEISREEGHRQFLEQREAMMAGRAGIPGSGGLTEPEMRPRKFIQTVKESLSTEEQLKQKVEEIRPEDYEVLHDKEQFQKAEFRISTPEKTTQAIEDLRSNKIPVNEEGYVAISLMRKLQAEGDFTRAAEVIDSFTYTLTDIGRLMRTASLWGQVTPATFIRWAEKQIDKVNANRTWIDIRLGAKRVTLTKDDKTYLVREKNRIDQMPEGIEKINANLGLIDYVAKKVPPGISEMIDAYRYQNMLSGIQTQERNIGTNTMMTFFTRPTDIATRGAIDYFRSLVSGKEREYYINNISDYYKDAFNSMPNAYRAFIQAMKGQVSISKPEMGIEAGTEFEAARARLLPKFLTPIQRCMEGQDRFFSTIIAAGEKAANMKNGMPEMEAQARAEAIGQKYLFRNKMKIDTKEYSILSNILEGVGLSMEYMRKIPYLGRVSGWTVPFLRTPLNVGIQMIEHSPLAALRKLSSWDQEISARFVNGSIVTGIGGMFALFGETTWLPPTGEEERKWWYATGRKPFSVKVGEKWVPMWYFGPYALAFGLPAMVKHYFVDSKTALTDQTYEKLGRMVIGVTRFLANQTSAQSIGGLFDLLSGGTSVDLPKYFENTFGQIIPAQSFLRWMAKVIDPVYRQSEDAIDAMLKNIPFASQTIPAYKKPFGEESEREWWNAVLPWDLGKEDLTYADFWPMLEMEGRLEYLERHETEAFTKMLERPEKAEKYKDQIKRIYDQYINVTEKGLQK